MRLCPSRGCWRRSSTIRVEHPEPRARADQDQPGEAPPAGASARACATAPPIECPTRTGGTSPSASRKAPSHSAYAATLGLAPAAERPVTRQIGRHDPRDVGEPVELRRPELRGSAGAVNQDEGRA